MSPRPVAPCPDCGNDIGGTTLTVDPDCPHGWETATGDDLAELYVGAWTEAQR